jgi:acetyl-CoA carboxylase carboxyl transferase subunit alpha
MEQVQVARHQDRPFTLDYIERVFTDWVELHGDRNFRDDEAIVGGWAAIGSTSVMVIGHQKGRDMKENLRRNFGMSHPEGYRKALRLMRQADKFGRPVITFIDTPGAYPGIGSEERGISEAIALNLREMSRLRTPLISVVIGEGGSGGALGLGVTDRILMLEHSVYSVISPEGCAAILWHSRDFKAEAAAALKLTSRDLLASGIVDEVIPEPAGGAHSDWDAAAEAVKASLERNLEELLKLDPNDLVEQRWEKYEAIGAWVEDSDQADGA